MPNFNLAGIPSSVFMCSAAEDADKSSTRANIVRGGRMLMYEYTRKGVNMLHKLSNNATPDAPERLDAMKYKDLNGRFQNDLLLYAANKVSEFDGTAAPANMQEFKNRSMVYAKNEHFFKVLQGIFQEIINPILPRVYSEAVDVFAETVEVGFGETAALSITSNDIPVFQDASWGAVRSIPRNTFYAKDITLNPTPRSCAIQMKWSHLVGNSIDFGQFFANMVAGMYAKTMGLWNAALTAAAGNTALIPSNLSVTFNTTNWVTLANRIAALNGTSINNTIAFGNAVALSKVLPSQTTGSANTDMDAAIATLLGADYVRSGYLGQFMQTRLMPLVDVIIPGTQNTAPATMLDSTKIWMMAANGRKPMTIAYGADTPMTLEIRPDEASDLTMSMYMTIALDSAAVFSSRIGLINI